MMTELKAEISAIKNSEEQMQMLQQQIEILREQKSLADEQVATYRNGYDAHRMKRGFMDLIESYENADRAYSSDQPGEWIAAVRVHMEQFLENIGIEKIDPEIGTLFRTAENTTSTEVVPTEDETLVGKIARVNSVGWWTTFPEANSDKYVLREANVSVYVLK